MSKATPTDVSGIGFDASQFGKPDDYTVYLQGVIDDVALEVRAVVGAAVYDAASTEGTDEQKLTFKRLKSAELYLSAAQLWRRIEIFERRAAVKGRDGGGTETIGSRNLANANEMEERGWNEVALVTGSSRQGGISVGVAETGMFDPR